MKFISVVTGTYNEEGNVELLYERLSKVFEQLSQYRFELIICDNASTDQTVTKLKQLAAKDKRVKIICNRRNFGATRSHYHALMAATGDAVILLASDLQDPPELIPDMIKAWENGEELVVCVKSRSQENKIMYSIRTLYYKSLAAMSGVEVIQHFTGFGLYDKKVMTELKKLPDSYPYLRGLICELGFKPYKIHFEHARRHHGKSHVNLYALYDLAMLGFTTHSMVPMRLATIGGFFLALTSFSIAVFYFIYKLIYWTSFEVGMAPLVIGTFGMFSIELMFIGLLGEYVGASHRQLLRHPLVVETERVNFLTDDESTLITTPQPAVKPLSETVLDKS